MLEITIFILQLSHNIDYIIDFYFNDTIRYDFLIFFFFLKQKGRAGKAGGVMSFVLQFAARVSILINMHVT
jgi:hypothetical protein